ncbi:MAG TPA: transglycosylase domain-containing protein [Nitrospirota bacterium]|nr:transglycosylase domain-containing protein [Nitrospirota bacterium]
MTKVIIRTGLGAIALCVLALLLWFIFLATNLPDVTRLKHYRPPAAAEVFDRTGQLVTSYHDRSLRFWVPVDDVPELVVWSVVIAEDDTFFAHQGINYRATWDALVHDVKKGSFARGGSTITQQMIKNVLLSREKTIGRKVREYFLARKAEEVLTKRKILEIYLNEVEWGEKLYGIEAASRYYFDKHVSELTVAESSLLAGMLPNPRYFNPYKRMDKAKDRQERVLSNMLQAKIITEDVYRSALRDPLTLRSERFGRFDFTVTEGDQGRPCYQRVLEERFLEAFGEDWLYREGRKIRTTLDKQLQDTLNAQEEQNGNARERVPERIVIIREGIDIRAISCTANEDTVRSWQGSAGVQAGERSVESMAPGSLDPGDLLSEGSSAEIRQD